MSTLFEQASLVMIPSGYKEDVVYSVKPTDGSGDLTFTRGSDGTRVNSQGLVERVPWNLIEDSENFGVNAVVYITIGPNVTTAPNGTTTADSMIEDGTNNLHAVYDFGALTYVAGVYTLSCYVKKGIRDWVRIQFYDGTNTQSVWANVNTGVLGTVVSPATASIESVGDGWYRVSISTAMLSATGGWAIYSATSDGGTTYTGTNGATALYLWGLQINIGSTAKPYFPTTDRLNVPRLDYSGGCPSLLLEPQRTNSLTYSEDFSNVAWTKNAGTITANNATSPDGTQNADLFTADGTSTQHYVLQTQSQSAKTISMFVKMGTQRYVQILTSGTANALANYDLQTGSVGGLGSASTASMVDYGNGWWRIVLTSSDALTGNIYLCYADSLTDGRFPSTTSTGTVWVWGAMAENAASYPTSYIPTTSASVTRVADEISDSTFTALPNANFTIFVEVNEWEGSDGNNYQLRFTDASGNRAIQFRNRPEGWRWLIVNDAGGSAYINSPSYTFTKMACRYNGTNYQLFADGSAVGSPFTATDSGILDYFNSYPIGIMGVKQMVCFPTALTDAECIALTTL